MSYSKRINKRDFYFVDNLTLGELRKSITLDWQSDRGLLDATQQLEKRRKGILKMKRLQKCAIASYS